MVLFRQSSVGLEPSSFHLSVFLGNVPNTKRPLSIRHRLCIQHGFILRRSRDHNFSIKCGKIIQWRWARFLFRQFRFQKDVIASGPLIFIPIHGNHFDWPSFPLNFQHTQKPSWPGRTFFIHHPTASVRHSRRSIDERKLLPWWNLNLLLSQRV